MKKINIGTYSFGMFEPMSVEDRIKKASEMGYTGIEFMVMDLERHSIEELARWLERYHMECVGLHAVADKMTENMEKTAKLGGKYIICPSYPFADEEEAGELVKLLEEKGTQAKQYGLIAGYHNHTAEFHKVKEKTLLELLLENSNPELVSFQLDCGWAAAAGVDCPSFIRKYRNRFVSIHVKECNRRLSLEPAQSTKNQGKMVFDKAFHEERSKAQCPMGSPESIIDWKAIKTALEEQSRDCIWTVEREYDYAGNLLQCLEEDCRWLKEKIRG